MRYKLLTDYCRLNGIRQLLVAHTLSDQAETVLLRILRGSGIDGIAGIPLKSEMEGVSVIRPLLGYPRQDIEYTLSQAGWTWVNDPSNEDVRFERSKIRKFINSFSEKEVLVKRLSLLASNAQRARAFLEKYTQNIITKHVEFHPWLYAAVDKGVIAALDEEIALRVLNVVLKRVSGKSLPGRLESLLELYYKLMDTGFKAHTLQGVQIRKWRDQLLFYREPSLVEAQKIIKKNIQINWDNRFLITANIDGSVGALGALGYAEVKKQLQGFKKPPYIEMVYPLPAIYNKVGGVAAVPHLKFLTKGVKAKVMECGKQIIPLFA
jgi:tRNA(Ile)-lysidine synthase